MRVYGDRPRRADPRAELTTLSTALEAALGQPAGLARHEALAAALIACGELAQGLADEAFARAGVDGPSPTADLALRATRALADAVWASWRGGFPVGEVDRSSLDALADADLPSEIVVKEGEGYAFYALYPETYGEAAATLPPGAATVVGLRSIGVSLGAMAAAALEAEAELLTLRPVGPPFRRELRLSPSTLEPMGDPRRRFIVVDEGPGLSGSSFGAVLDALEQGGVGPERTVVLPSHAGDLGPEAKPRHRARWAVVDRRLVPFEQAIAPRLAGWVEDLTGQAVEAVADLSGGAWRALSFSSEGDWPAVHAGQERRKFLVRSADGPSLLKFAGLGRIGERKLARAQALANAGFAPEPLGLRHGFLVERWIAGGDRSGPPPLSHVAEYLAFRARRFPAAPDAGASLEELLDMARVNTAEALGEEAAETLQAWRRRLPRLAGAVRRVVTDNRMHRHEWLEADGRWLKTDALDHAESHDLVGAQDIAWDVAGAEVEFELEPAGRERLGRVTGADPELTLFYAATYLAFQLGAYALAQDANAGWPAEAARLCAARERYADRLRRMLSA